LLLLKGIARPSNPRPWPRPRPRQWPRGLENNDLFLLLVLKGGVCSTGVQPGGPPFTLPSPSKSPTSGNAAGNATGADPGLKFRYSAAPQGTWQWDFKCYFIKKYEKSAIFYLFFGPRAQNGPGPIWARADGRAGGRAAGRRAGGF